MIISYMPREKWLSFFNDKLLSFLLDLLKNKAEVFLAVFILTYLLVILYAFINELQL